MSDQAVTVREEGKTTDVATNQEQAQAKEVATVTAAQARVVSVANALDKAYAQASTLQLTPEEAKALSAPFPDEAFRLGAGGDPNLIYIEHAYLRQRLNEVLGVGAAVPVMRSARCEEYTYMKDGRQKVGVRVYVEMALLVRGCLVGEAIGDATYYPDNAKTSYSDALESAKSCAMRRCCKEFGVGLQAWMKGWGDEWKKRNAGGGRTPLREPQERQQPPPQQAARTQPESRQAPSQPAAPKNEQPRQAPRQEERQRNPEPSDVLEVETTIGKVYRSDGVSKKSGKRWERWAIKGEDEIWYGTFSYNHGKVLDEASTNGRAVIIAYEEDSTGRGRNIMNIRYVEQPVEPDAVDTPANAEEEPRETAYPEDLPY